MVYFQSRKYSSLRPFSEILVAVASLTHSPFTKVQIKARNRARYIFIIVVFIYLESRALISAFVSRKWTKYCYRDQPVGLSCAGLSCVVD